MRVAVSFEGGLDSIVVGERRQLRFNFHSEGAVEGSLKSSSSPDSSTPVLRIFHLVAFLSKVFVTKPELFSRPYTPGHPDLGQQQGEANAKVNTQKEEFSPEELLRAVQSDEELQFPLNSLLSEGAALAGGILCLVNGVDYEVLESLETPIHDKDNVIFISTLHGG